MLTTSSCVAVIRTPPLSGQTAQGTTHSGVAITSGQFRRPHQIIGLLQTKQEGYRTKLFGEINKRSTNPAQMLQALGRYAKELGADGIQQFTFRLENPKSDDEQERDRVLTTLEIVSALSKEKSGAAAQKTTEGETTSYLIKGELVRWVTQSATTSADRAHVH